MLLAAVAASVAWELAGLLLAVAPSANRWLAYQLADAARLAEWLAFLATLLPVSSGKVQSMRFLGGVHLAARRRRRRAPCSFGHGRLPGLQACGPDSGIDNRRSFSVSGC